MRVHRAVMPARVVLLVVLTLLMLMLALMLVLVCLQQAPTLWPSA